MWRFATNQLLCFICISTVHVNFTRIKHIHVLQFCFPYIGLAIQMLLQNIILRKFLNWVNLYKISTYMNDIKLVRLLYVYSAIRVFGEFAIYHNTRLVCICWNYIDNVKENKLNIIYNKTNFKIIYIIIIQYKSIKKKNKKLKLN